MGELRKADPSQIIEENLTIMVGTGATNHVGSDCYPLYVSERLPNGVIGLYSPNHYFDDKHPWYGGSAVVDPFDSKHPSEQYLKRRYGHWWNCTKDGTPICRSGLNIAFKGAYCYLDPSF